MLAALFLNQAASAKQSKTTHPHDSALSAGALFNLTNVWNVHLQFTPEQWQALEPKQEGFGPFGGPGPGDNAPRSGNRGGPGERGGPGGGGFGPGMFLAPAFLSQADRDADQKVSHEEFHALAERWFAEWDKTSAGRVNADQLRAGLNTALTGGPAGRGPGPGISAGPGRRGFGMNLQGAEGKRNGLASAAGIEFEYVHADLEFDGHWLKDVAVRYKGNGTFMQSRGSFKRSLKVDLNRYHKGQKLGGISTLNLHNNVTDASWMNEVLSHKLFRDAGVPAPRTTYARVSVTVPGKYDREYFGLYSLVEDIDTEFAQDRFGTRKGAILKPVAAELFADLGDDWAKYKQTYDPKSDLTPAQQQRIINFCKLLAHADDARFAAEIGDYLDLDEFARFMSVTVWLSTLDSILSLGQNFYVYLATDPSKLKFLPWDLDHSFGQFPMRGSQVEREQLSLWHPWQGNNRLLERVFQVEAFRNLYRSHLEAFNGELFKPERFAEQVDALAKVLRPAVQDESAEKLERFNKAVAGQPIEPAGFGPPGRGGPRFGGGSFPPVKPIKGFVTARAKSVSDQLSGKSKGEVLEEFGFGGPRSGRGGPGEGGGFGPANFVGDMFMTALDADKDQAITRAEFVDGFEKWFSRWDSEHAGVLTEEQLRRGMNRDFMPAFGGPGPRP